MGERIAEVIGAAAGPALALYAAFRSKSDAKAAARALGVLAALSTLAVVVLMALQWFLVGRATVAVNALLAIALGIGLWFALEVWRRTTWALLTFAAAGVLMTAWMFVRSDVGSGGTFTVLWSAMWLAVWFATWRIVNAGRKRPPTSAHDVE